jgi:hypothetical protein
MTLRVQCDKVGGEYVAKLGDLTASADTRTNAVEAVLKKAHEARGKRVEAAHREAEPAPAREAAHDGESMGDGPSAPLGSHFGD